MKGLAITSMILGILAIIMPVVSCGVLAPVGTLLALLGLILGSVSISQYNKAQTTEGKGMAKAGLVLSIIVLVGNIIMMLACGGLGMLGASS